MLAMLAARREAGDRRFGLPTVRLRTRERGDENPVLAGAPAARPDSRPPRRINNATSLQQRVERRVAKITTSHNAPVVESFPSWRNRVDAAGQSFLTAFLMWTFDAASRRRNNNNYRQH